MRRKTDTKHGARAHIYVLDKHICQVRKYGELGFQTVGEVFFFLILLKKLWMGSHFMGV
jgi:hypothetical protein